MSYLKTAWVALAVAGILAVLSVPRAGAPDDRRAKAGASHPFPAPDGAGAVAGGHPW